MSGQESNCDQTSDQKERTVIEACTLSPTNELDIIGYNKGTKLSTVAVKNLKLVAPEKDSNIKKQLSSS